MDYDSLAQQHGGTSTPTSPAGGSVDYDNIASSLGGTTATTAPKDDRNIVQKVAGAFIDPALTLAARPGQAIGAGISHLLSKVTGNPTYAQRSDAMMDQPMRLPIFGTMVKAPSQETTESSIGEGLSTVALGIPNPMVMGAALGTGEAMQHNSGALGTAAGAIIGAAGGKLTDIGFQKIAPLVTSAIEKFGSPIFEKISSVIPDAYKTSFQHMADAVSHVTPSTEGKIPVISDIFQKGKNIMKSAGEKLVEGSQGMRQKMLQSSFRDTVQKYVAPSRLLHNMEVNIGTDPLGVLSAYGNGATIPGMEQGKVNPNETIDFLKEQIGQLSKIKTAAVKANNVGVPTDEVEAKAGKIIGEQNWSKMRKDQAQKEVGNIVSKMRESYPDGTLPLIETDTLKSEQAALSKSYNNNGKEPFVYDAHGIVGKAAKEIVEGRTADAPTKALNKWIQSHYDAIDLLESLRGKAPNGGLLTQAAHRIGGEVVGSIGGSMVGHPWAGALVGHFGADAIDGILGANFISNPIKRSLIEGMQNADPEVVKAALKYLDDKAAGKATQLSLPSPQKTLPAKADISGTETVQAGKILDRDGNILGYSSTGEGAVQKGTRKLPVRLEPSEYTDKFYTPDKKLPVIEAGKKTPQKSDLPTVEYGSNPKVGDQTFVPKNQLKSEKPARTTKTTNITSKNISEIVPQGSMKVKAGENPGNFNLPEKPAGKWPAFGELGDRKFGPASLKDEGDFVTLRINKDTGKPLGSEMVSTDKIATISINKNEYNAVKKNPQAFKELLQKKMSEALPGKANIKKILPAAVGIGAATYKGGPSSAGNKGGSDVEPTVIKDIQGKIKYNETRGEKNPYGYSRPSGDKKQGKALGAYQVTEAELKTYSPMFLGKAVTAKEFLNSPKMQDEYIKEKISSLVRRGLTNEQILAVHNKGMSDMTKAGLSKTVKAAAPYIKSARTMADLNGK